MRIAFSFVSAFKAVLFTIILSTSAFSQVDSILSSLCKSHDNGLYSIRYSPVIYLGTHRNGIGEFFAVSTMAAFQKVPLGFDLSININPMLYEEYFGLPGRVASIEPSGTIAIIWGKPCNFGNSKWIKPRPFRHTLSYRASYYLSSDNTSQGYAEFRYELNLANKLIALGIGNDDLTFLHTDMFRSAAVDLSLSIEKGSNIFGGAFGIKLWHGDYTDQLYLTRDETYDFESILGGDYTVGLFFISFHYNYLKASVGYDADRIRTCLQNGMHKIMNNGMTPSVKRNDRLFLELTLFGNNGQF